MPVTERDGSTGIAGRSTDYTIRGPGVGPGPFDA
jgi:hypothetical protein